MIRRLFLLSTCAVLALGSGCERAPDTTPPQLHLGEQECAWCRMLISDERFAAALVFERAGRVEKPVFDDINCVFGYLEESPPALSYQVYTHDFTTREWLNGRQATYVHSSVLETPMAAQIAAVPSRAAAEQLLESYPGDLLSYEEVADLFTGATRQTESGGHPDE